MAKIPNKFKKFNFTKIGKTTYFLECNQRKYILKQNTFFMTPNIFTNFHKYYSFKREYFLYNLLSKYNFRYFNFPRVYEKKNKYLLLEYIEEKKNKIFNYYDTNELICQIYEFNTVLLRNNDYIKFSFLKMFTNQRVSILKGILSYNKKINTNLKLPLMSIYILLKDLSKRNKSFKKINILTHRDISNNGNIRYDDVKKKLVVFDFGSFSVEKKWILGDLVDITFSMDFLQFNSVLMEEYFKKLKREYIEILNKINLEDQLRIALLRKSINYLAYSNKQYPKLNNFIQKILLNDILYQKWFYINCKI